MSGKRTVAYLSLAAAVLAAAAVGCWTSLVDSRDAALTAAADLKAARRSADRIVSARRSTPVAGGLRPEREQRRRIDVAAGRADIAPEAFETIEEQPGRRIGNTGYEERPTQVVIREVSLQQAVTFLHAVAGESQGVSVKSIRLTASREQDASDRWRAEATLAFLAQAPRRTVRDATDGGTE